MFLPILMSFTPPQFHFNESAVVVKECTPQVAFYGLFKQEGVVEGFTKDGEYIYEVFFANIDKHLDIPEKCLAKTTKEKK